MVMVQLDEDVHKILKVYVAQNDIKTLSGGVRDLLTKVLGPNKVPLDTTSNTPDTPNSDASNPHIIITDNKEDIMEGANAH